MLLAAAAALLCALTVAGTSLASAGAAATTGQAASIAALPEVGTLYIADDHNNRVVEVTPGGTQTEIGNGLNQPTGVAVDATGNVYIADSGNNRVVKVTPGGTQSTVVGTGLNQPSGVAVDAAGNVYITDSLNARVVKVTPGGTQSTLGTGLGGPFGVAVDATGNVYITDALHNRLVEVTPGGTQTEIGAGLELPSGVAVDTTGDVTIADYSNNRVVKRTPGGTQSTIGTGLTLPAGVAIDAAGNRYIADSGNSRVVEVTPGGTQSTIGTGLDHPFGVAVYAPPPTFTESAPRATASVDFPYSYTYAASTPAGEPAATFAVADGSLPPGLHLNGTTGVLSGAPTTAGTFTFTAETMNAAHGTLAAPTTVTVVDPTTAYVTALMHDFLGRTPDPRGLAYWTTLIHGGTSHRTVSATFAGSREALSFFVNGQYMHILGRAADAGGRNYWVSRLQAHTLSTNALTVALYASTELYVKVGGKDAAWVNALYASSLGRTPSSSELNYWVRQIHHYSRRTVARAIVIGPEATDRDVDNLYANLLGRTPDNGGRTFTRTVIQHFGVLSAADRISATREYSSHAQQRFG